MSELPKESKDFLNNTIVEFHHNAYLKFVEGQKAHGGLITDRNCEVELENELIDAIFYFYALRLQNQKLRLEIEALKKKLYDLTPESRY